ncbi:MAG: FecR domain-containing protein [Sedimentisphaerales bacterium]|nr:FecR domain-containing protein [Sedimentisphaerales bacterium]
MGSKRMNDIEAFLKRAPKPPQMDRTRRRAIWQNIEASLGGEEDHADKRREVGRRDRRLWWLAAGASAAAVVALVLILRPGLPQPQKVERHQPTVLPVFGWVEIARGRCAGTDPQGRERALASGESIHTGDTLSVGPAGGARIRLHDQSEVWLCQGTQIECGSLRSEAKPTLRLLRGELRANITASPGQLFAVETPTALLNVLGTQFNCQAFPHPNPAEAPTMSTKEIVQKAFTVLTVLSGTVQVCGGNGPQTIHATQRSVVGPDTATVAAVPNTEYTRQWLGEPGSRGGPTILYLLPVVPSMLHSLWAMDGQDGEPRHVTDFVGSWARVILRVDGDLALIGVGSLIHTHVGGGIGSAGRPLAEDQVFLVNLKTGAKTHAPHMEDCDPLYLSMSPDRRKLAFVGSRQAGPQPEFGLFVIDIESAQVARMLDGAIKTCPNWSPDSRWLVVSKSEGYVTDHWLVLVDTLAGEVVETGLHGAGAVFAPEGQEIVYSSGLARGGRWYQGVPSTGNLYRASLPSGPARQVTSLTDAGAVLPMFSPDGSFVAYWELRGKEQMFHLLHTETGNDQPVCEGPISPIVWLDAGTSLALTGDTRAPQNEAVVRIVDIVDGRAAVRDVSATRRELPEDMAEAGRQFAARLFVVGEALDAARHAEDMQEVERAQTTWQQISQTFSAFVDEVTGGQAWEALALSELDFAPYLTRFDQERRLSLAERADRVVYARLHGYIPAVLNMYCQKHDALPANPEALARWATEGGSWRINHVRGSDTEIIRHWFIMPGVDPNQVVTSYALVDCDPEQGRWVLQSPRLPSGRMYRAVYRVEKDPRGSFHTREEIQAIE